MSYQEAQGQLKCRPPLFGGAWRDPVYGQSYREYFTDQLIFHVAWQSHVTLIVCLLIIISPNSRLYFDLSPVGHLVGSIGFGWLIGRTQCPCAATASHSATRRHCFLAFSPPLAFGFYFLISKF